MGPGPSSATNGTVCDTRKESFSKLYLRSDLKKIPVVFKFFYSHIALLKKERRREERGRDRDRDRGKQEKARMGMIFTGLTFKAKYFLSTLYHVYILRN